MPRHTQIDHKAVVVATKADPGVFKLVGIYPSAEGTKSAVLRVPGAERMPAYLPAGTYEAYEAYEAYAAVIAEYRKPVARLEEVEQRDAARAVKAGPAAGEFTEAVLLLNAVAAEMRGLHAKQAAQFLDLRGQHEAARRVQEELKARSGLMSARQAAMFLIELAAAREACTECKDGRIDYRGLDGEFVSLRCSKCRRDVVAGA